jgi:hypothetical protein
MEHHKRSKYLFAYYDQGLAFAPEASNSLAASLVLTFFAFFFYLVL